MAAIADPRRRHDFIARDESRLQQTRHAAVLRSASMLSVLLALLASVARMSFGEVLWCDATSAVMNRYAEARVPFVVTDVVVDAVVAGDDVIVVSGSGETRRVVRAGRRGEVETLLDIEKRIAIGGESLVTRGEHWWYGVTAVRDGVQSTVFVSDDAPPSVVPISGAALVRWLALQSETPRALEVSFARDGSPMATEINARGPLRSWHLPMLFSAVTSAALLPDGKIAVVTQQKDSSRLDLFLLGDDDHIDSVTLGYRTLLQLAIAVDDGGRIVLAVSTTDHRVVAASIDPAHPAEPLWRQLRDGVQLSSYAGELRVIAVDGGVVASWMNRSVTPPRIEASNVYATHAPAEFRAIGSVVDRGRNTSVALRVEHGEPVWTWDDGARLLMRRLPASIDGYVWIERVADWCGVRVR